MLARSTCQSANQQSQNDRFETRVDVFVLTDERECKTSSEARETMEGEHRSYARRKGSCIAAAAAAALLL